MKGYLYKICNNKNSKIYIGKTYMSLDKRFRQHVGDSKKEKNKSRLLYKAFNKYGHHSFYIELIGEFEEESLEAMEIFYIDKYDSYRNGYNSTLGGDGKRYFEYSDEYVVERYKILKHMGEVAEELRCDRSTISKILRSNNIDTVNKHKNININYNNENLFFKNTEDASEWVLDNKLSKTLNKKSIRRSMAMALSGRIDTYLGIKWK